MEKGTGSRKTEDPEWARMYGRGQENPWQMKGFRKKKSHEDFKFSLLSLQEIFTEMSITHLCLRNKFTLGWERPGIRESCFKDGKQDAKTASIFWVLSNGTFRPSHLCKADIQILTDVYNH